MSVVFRKQDGTPSVWVKRRGEVHWHDLLYLLSGSGERLHIAPVYVVVHGSPSWSDLWMVLRTAAAAMVRSVHSHLTGDRPSSMGNDVIFVTAGWGDRAGVEGVGLRAWMYPHLRIRFSEPILAMSPEEPLDRLFVALAESRPVLPDRALALVWASEDGGAANVPVNKGEVIEFGEFCFHDLILPAFSRD